MFRNYLLTILGLSLSFTAKAENFDENLMVVGYPLLPELSISVPKTYEIYNKERYGIFSDDGKLEIAGTAYQSKGKDMSLQRFADNRLESIPNNMPWYKAVTELKHIKGLGYDAVVIEYKGIWPDEAKPSSYVVVMAKSEDILLSLTFTLLTDDLSSRRPVIKNIIESVNFKSD